MDEIALTLNNLTLAQMVLAWIFVGGYALALGGMLSTKGSLRAAMAAGLSAVMFCVLSANWVHGALLIVFAVGGMGLFVASSWVLTHGLAWWLHRRQSATPLDAPARLPQTAELSGPSGALRNFWRTHLAP